MREGWETTLGEVALINPEMTPQWPKDHRIRYVDIARVNWGCPIPIDIPQQQFGSAPGRARRLIRAGDVVVSTVRPNLRAMAVVPSDLDGEVASTGLAVIRSRSEVLLPGYIWAIVSHESFSKDMVKKATGSNYPAVRPSDLASYPVTVPPLHVQRRIVDMIGALDVTIEAAEKSLSVARQAARQLRQAAFSRATDEAPSVSAGIIFDMLLGRQKSARQSTGEHVIPYLRAANLSSDGFLLDDVQTMNFTPVEQDK